MKVAERVGSGSGIIVLVRIERRFYEMKNANQNSDDYLDSIGHISRTRKYKDYLRICLYNLKAIDAASAQTESIDLLDPSVTLNSKSR